MTSYKNAVKKIAIKKTPAAKKVAKKKPEMKWEKVGPAVKHGQFTTQQYKVSGTLVDQLHESGWKPVPRKKSVLERADELINGDRAASYGSVTDNWTRIAVGWAQILGVPVTADQVGLMMIWLKVARQVHKKSEDNVLDICGYAGCLEKLAQGK